MNHTAENIMKSVDKAVAELSKSSSISNPPADPNEKGTVQPGYEADASPKKTTGVDGPAGGDSQGKNAEGDLSAVKTGDKNNPPPVKKETDDTDPNPLAKSASEVIGSIRGILEKNGLAKKASEDNKPEDKKPEEQEAEDKEKKEGHDKSAEAISQDLPNDPASLIKVAHLVLETEEGRKFVEGAVKAKLGEEQAQAMLEQVDATYDNLVKQASEELSEEYQIDQAIQSFLEDPGIDKKAKEEFSKGLVIHQKGIETMLDELEEKLGGEELLKSASEADQKEAVAFGEAAVEAYNFGAQLAKKAAAMMEEQGMSPEELEQALVELDNYSLEEKVAAIQLLVEQGAIDEATAQELVEMFASQEQGGAALAGGEEMPPEYAAGMEKAASVLKELEAEKPEKEKE